MQRHVDLFDVGRLVEVELYSSRQVGRVHIAPLAPHHEVFIVKNDLDGLMRQITASGRDRTRPPHIRVCGRHRRVDAGRQARGGGDAGRISRVWRSGLTSKVVAQRVVGVGRNR